MTVSNPTYITKSKHGVYYFQLLVPDGVARKVGIRSNRYIRSLRTKDKRVALAKARKIQSRFHFLVMSTSKDKIKNQLDTLFEEDEQSKELAEIARRDELIHIAYFVDRRYDQVEPKTNLAWSMFFDELTQQEQEALKYVADNDINLRDYDSKFGSNAESNSIVYVKEKPELRPISLDGLAQKYLKHRETSGCNARTIALYADQIKIFQAIVNVVEASDLDEDAVDRYVEGLSKFPAYYKTGKYKHLSVSEVLNLNLTEGLLSKSSMKTYSTNIKAFLDWSIKSKYVAAGVSVPLEGVFKHFDRDSYKPFSKQDLESLFISTPYMKGEIRKASSYWVPIIGLFTGARQNEICQLACSDIKSETVVSEKVYYFDFNDEDDKSLKGKSSKRKVPMHPILIKLGFVEFVGRQVAQGKTRVFHELKKDTKGKYNDAFQKWFARHREKCGVENKDGSKKVFHSFRHTVITHLRNEAPDIPLENVKDVVGHANVGVTLSVYAPVLSMERKHEIIKRINFGLNFDQIRRWTKT